MKKDIIIGFVVGVLANSVGVVLYALLFSKFNIKTTFQIAYEEGHLGSFIALGALLNLAAFFIFLKLNQDYRARGVLIATLLAAILIVVFKIV
jgi:hypothetical protein